MNSAVSRALRSRDQRRLGAPDNGMRRRTPTCPTGSGSPLAGPTMVCSSAMFPSRTPTEIRVLLHADRLHNPAVGKRTTRPGDATSLRARHERPRGRLGPLKRHTPLEALAGRVAMMDADRRPDVLEPTARLLADHELVVDRPATPPLRGAPEPGRRTR